MLITRLPVAAAFALASLVAGAQEYPSKPVRIVTLGAGGSSDFVARQLAQGLASTLGQPFVVDNRPGAAASAELVARAAPDAHMLLAIGSLFWIAPLMQSMSYDPVKDFAPIAQTHASPNIVVVHPSLPVNSVKQLIALAKARPGELNFASGGIGGAPHLAAELFKAMAGINMVNVSYKGTGQAVNELVGGHVQLMFASAVVQPHVTSGRLRGVAVTGAQPSPLFPGLPTVTSAGLPGYEFGNAAGLFAPAKTPDAIVRRLNQESVRVLSRPEVKERFLATGVEAAPGTPEQLGALVKSEMSRLGKVIKDAHIRAE